MRDGPIFWKQRMGAVNGKTFKKYKEKKKNNQFFRYFIVLFEKYSTVITFLVKHFKEKHVSCLPLCIFFDPKFVNDVKVTRAGAGNM